MTMTEFSEPPAADLFAWRSPPPPTRGALVGRTVRLEPLDPAAHAAALFDAAQGPAADPRLWDYLAIGPFADEAALATYLAGIAPSSDPLFMTIVRPDGRPCGMAAWLRITPAHGVIEIGHIWFGRELARSTAATEAIFLLAAHAFEVLGYRRLEWKCNAQNERSRAAALRFGFAFEGIFRQHMIIKGRNRDTAWYAMLDHEWPSLRRAYDLWLAPANFDEAGRQRTPLGVLRQERHGVAGRSGA